MVVVFCFFMRSLILAGESMFSEGGWSSLLNGLRGGSGTGTLLGFSGLCAAVLVLGVYSAGPPVGGGSIDGLLKGDILRCTSVVVAVDGSVVVIEV